MNKIIKKLISLSVATLLLLSCLAFTASAAAKTTIAFSNNNPKANDAVTVTVTANGAEAMYSTEFEVSYNPEVLRFESGDSAAGGAGVVKVAGAVSGATKQSYTLSFTAIAAGSSTVAISGKAYYNNDKEDNLGASATMTVSDATKSDNADLKSLSLSKGTLSPKFSASKTSYTASVANDVTDVKVYATAADGEAKVEVSGKSALEVGENVRTVTVTAASGAQKTYKITITRAAEGDTASEPDQTSESENNPYEATVDGVTYTVATDVSGITLPKGFSASTAEYNGTQVAVAKDLDSNYTIYYLKAADGEAYVPYLLTADGATFEKLRYVTFDDKMYIFAEIPEGRTAPDGYYDTFIKIGDFDVKAFASRNEELSDLYYVYCFYDGGFRIYRYDRKENVLQRAPEFKLVTESENKLPQNAGFAERFKSLSANAKITVIGLLLAALGAVVLIVLLVIRLVKGRQPIDDDDFNGDMLFRAAFDDVTVTDSGKNEEKQEETEEEPEEVEKQ
ncbi:MAG: cadherin-like beta sandwich domain-containing protein [Acutalibacteraceae bacterium]